MTKKDYILLTTHYQYLQRRLLFKITKKDFQDMIDDLSNRLHQDNFRFNYDKFENYIFNK